VEATVVDTLPCAVSIRVNEAEPLPGYAFGGDDVAPGSPMGPGSRQPGDATSSDAIPAPESSNIVDSGAIKLGLPGYPRALPSWRQVEGGAELTCS
jgi:hypothetical protein